MEDRIVPLKHKQGAFEVSIEGKLIWSKLKTEKWPLREMY